MKLICPISGFPFYTSDNLPISIQYKHPIFSLNFESLIFAMTEVEKQEIKLLDTLSSSNSEHVSDAFIAILAAQAWNSKAYKEPAFQLYSNKKLILLAFMNSSGLLDSSENIPCAISPKHLYVNYARAIPLLVWANNFNPSILVKTLPRYKLSETSKKMENLTDYLDLLMEAKTSVNKMRSLTEDVMLDKLERRIQAILNERRITGKEENEGRNIIAAKWALMQSSAPKHTWDYWFGILSKEPKTLYNLGIYDSEKKEHIPVRYVDLKELQGHMLDNLITPSQDDSSFYADAVHLTMKIINSAIKYFEEQDAAYALSDNQAPIAVGLELHNAAVEHKIAMPVKQEFKSPLLYQVAMAKWRISVRAAIALPKEPEVKSEHKENKDGGYDFL